SARGRRELVFCLAGTMLGLAVPGVLVGLLDLTGAVAARRPQPPAGTGLVIGALVTILLGIALAPRVGRWLGAVHRWLGARLLAAAAGLAMVLAAPWLARAVTALDLWLMRGLLGPGRLAQRVADLEATRARAVDDSAALLRRLERNLHDGTQIRLATLAMNLG